MGRKLKNPIKLGAELVAVGAAVRLLPEQPESLLGNWGKPSALDGKRNALPSGWPGRRVRSRRARTFLATLQLRDGRVVRRFRLSEHDTFVFCLRTSRYYDWHHGTVFVERDWAAHRVKLDAMDAASSPYVLDVVRAECGLPLAIHERAFL